VNGGAGDDRIKATSKDAGNSVDGGPGEDTCKTKPGFPDCEDASGTET